MRKKHLVWIISLLMLAACQTTPTATSQSPSLTPTAPIKIYPTEESPLVSATPNTLSTAEATPVPTIAFSASAPATCEVSSVVPELPSDYDSLFPSVSDSDWSYGSETASVIFYIYSDYQCPYCAKLSPILKELQAAYPDDVRIVYRQFPLTSIHDKSSLAAQAAEAAGLQGKYWQMHDLLFEKQTEWTGLTVEEFTAWLNQQAAALNLKPAQFASDLTSSSIVDKVNQSESAALALNLGSTPFIFINKIAYSYVPTLDSLSSMVEYFLLSNSAYTACPEITIDPDKEYFATLKTEKGDIVLELYPQQAPMAVNNFVFLAREKWYDNSTFFRVIPGYLVQAGDPSGSGFGNPGYKFTNEVTSELRFDRAGVVGMANSGDGTNGSQFFITYSALSEFDGQYTIFGQVVSGMDVLESLRPRNSDQDQIVLPADNLISITIEEK